MNLPGLVPLHCPSSCSVFAMYWVGTLDLAPSVWSLSQELVVNQERRVNCEVHIVDLHRKTGSYCSESVLWKGDKLETGGQHEWDQKTDLWRRYSQRGRQGGVLGKTKSLLGDSCCLLVSIRTCAHLKYKS